MILHPTITIMYHGDTRRLVDSTWLAAPGPRVGVLELSGSSFHRERAATLVSGSLWLRENLSDSIVLISLRISSRHPRGSAVLHDFRSMIFAKLIPMFCSQVQGFSGRDILRYRITDGIDRILWGRHQISVRTVCMYAD